MDILFIGKRDDELSRRASTLLHRRIDSAKSFFLSKGEALPTQNVSEKIDYFISYLSPLVIPASVLRQARKAAINFHPGTPDYPGIGCTNFALYNEEKEYGVTCHYMEKKVDSGKIIAVRRFPILEDDSVFSLTQRCYREIYVLFEEILEFIIQDKPLPSANERWTRAPYTRAQLNELGRITEEMSEGEVRKRVRAMSYPGAPGAFMEKAGFRFDVSLKAF